MISYNVLQKRLSSQKYKKCSPGKYALLLYVTVSIRWISIGLTSFFSCPKLMVNKSFGKIVLIFNGDRSTTLGCKDIGKSEFETKTQ